jgi:hypothetical protein
MEMLSPDRTQAQRWLTRCLSNYSRALIHRCRVRLLSAEVSQPIMLRRTANFLYLYRDNAKPLKYFGRDVSEAAPVCTAAV